GACVTGTTKCEVAQPYECVAGSWTAKTPCPTFCKGDTCGAACTPGKARCNAGATQICTAAGDWQTLAMCPFVCGSNVCAGACTPGSAQCAAGAQPQGCDTNGFWYNNGTACTTPTCSLGECKACTNGATQCSGKVLQTCTGGAWVNTATCPHVCKAT